MPFGQIRDKNGGRDGGSVAACRTLVSWWWCEWAKRRGGDVGSAGNMKEMRLSVFLRQRRRENGGSSHRLVVSSSSGGKRRLVWLLVVELSWQENRGTTTARYRWAVEVVEVSAFDGERDGGA